MSSVAIAILRVTRLALRYNQKVKARGSSMLTECHPHGLGQWLECILEGSSLLERNQHGDRRSGPELEILAADLLHFSHLVRGNAHFGGVKSIPGFLVNQAVG